MKATICIFISALSQLALPFAVSSAYAERGYFAIGGEYGLIVLSLICMFTSINSITQAYEKALQRAKRLIKAYRKTVWGLVNLKHVNNNNKLSKKAG